MDDIIRQPLAHWVLSDKINLPDFDLAYRTAFDGISEPQIANTLVPGGERWAGIGLDYGMLSFSNAREHLAPREFGIRFKTIRSLTMMDKIWENVTDLSANKEPLHTSKTEKIAKLIVWAPGSMFADPMRTYFIYHPLVLETKNKKRNGSKSWLLVGYNKDHSTDDINRDWTSLPTIDFLPEDKALNNRRLIAGSAGLLVIDGGQQGSNQQLNIWGRVQTPNEKFWKHPEIYMDCQSMIFVTNPLTKEYIMLPPLPGRLMNKKVGRFIWRNKERTSYILILIGWDAEVETESKLEKLDRITTKGSKKRKGSGETIGLFVFCSQQRCYVYYDEIEGRPLPYQYLGSSCIGVIGYGIFVGGMKVTAKSKPSEARNPCVYYFNVSNSATIKKLMIPFIVSGIPNSTSVQAPKVVQGGPTRIFAITRAPSAAITLYIVEIVLDEHQQRFQNFQLITSMPSRYFHTLFSKSPCNDSYEVSSCNGIISFKATRKGISIVQYNVNGAEWSHTYFPRQRSSTAACYHLADAAYEPNFLAKP